MMSSMDEHERELLEHIAEQREALCVLQEADTGDDEELALMREEIQAAIAEMESAVMEIKRDRLLAALELAQASVATLAAPAIPSPLLHQPSNHSTAANNLHPHTMQTSQHRSATYDTAPPAGGLHASLHSVATLGSASTTALSDILMGHYFCRSSSHVDIKLESSVTHTQIKLESNGMSHTKIKLENFDRSYEDVKQEGLQDEEYDDASMSGDSENGEEGEEWEGEEVDESGLQHTGLGARFDKREWRQAGLSDPDMEYGEEDQDLRESAVMRHARIAAEAGAQTDTAHFADWETHSRGIASKLLAKMGYVKGTGLGKTGSGVAAPLVVEMLQHRRGLGGSSQAKKGAVGPATRLRKPKRSRGGARVQLQKKVLAKKTLKGEIRQQAIAEEKAAGQGAGLFSYINNLLGDKSAAAKIRYAQIGEAPPPSMTTTPGGTTLWASENQDSPRHDRAPFLLRKPDGDRRGESVSAGLQKDVGAKAAPGSDRVGLVAHQQKVAGMKVQIKALNEQLARNKDNKSFRIQIEANLAKAVSYLGELTAQEDRAVKAVTQKEAHRKWAKF